MKTLSLLLRCFCAALLLAGWTLSAAHSQNRSPKKTPTPSAPQGKPFTKHYRADSGIEIKYRPDLEEAKQARIAEEVRKKQEELMEEMKRLEASPPPPAEPERIAPPLLLDCMFSNLDVEKFHGYENKELNEVVEFDMLVMWKREIPSDTQTIFGANTLVIGFDDKAPNPSWIPVRDFGIECLPYRVRVFGNRIEKYTGMDALKNFDLAKKGKFHEYVVSKYGKKETKKRK